MPLAVILVDDSPLIRKSLTAALAELADALVIGIAETADEGTAALDAHSDTWRLTVVDLFLRAGNGLQVLRAGRERRSDQHMVVLTNYATPDIRRKSIECGADAVFDKSTELDQFLELCRRYTAEEAQQVAAAPKPRRSHKANLDGGVDELVERVAVDRLLTDAVSGSVERNLNAVRDHLTRQGLRRRGSDESTTNEPTTKPKGKTNATQSGRSS